MQVALREMVKGTWQVFGRERWRTQITRDHLDGYTEPDVFSQAPVPLPNLIARHAWEEGIARARIPSQHSATQTPTLGLTPSTWRSDQAKREWGGWEEKQLMHELEE